ncbi:uncharacterized protein LOC134228444 [Saccostrea cucullata]|uniref:uncharacterized protein LOC134228444 n=1 Tax=Saccostrea cuccullata TaxID=36930 RepID=UPI002ED4D424
MTLTVCLVLCFLYFTISFASSGESTLNKYLSGYVDYVSTAKSIIKSPFFYGPATAFGVVKGISKSEKLQPRLNLTINNELTNGILVKPDIDLEYGVEEANPKRRINPGESFSMSLRGTNFLPVGTTGVLTYHFKETDFALSITWSVPFFYYVPLMYSANNRFGINVYKKPCEQKANSTLAIHGPGESYSFESTEVYKSEKVVLYGIMTSGMTDANLEIFLTNS